MFPSFYGPGEPPISSPTASPISVTTPPVARANTMDAPWSGEKVPLPAARKRQLLEALEVECSNLDALLLKKRQLAAKRAFEAARNAPHAHRP